MQKKELKKFIKSNPEFWQGKPMLELKDIRDPEEYIFCNYEFESGIKSRVKVKAIKLSRHIPVVAAITVLLFCFIRFTPIGRGVAKGISELIQNTFNGTTYSEYTTEKRDYITDPLSITSTDVTRVDFQTDTLEDGSVWVITQNYEHKHGNIQIIQQFNNAEGFVSGGFMGAEDESDNYNGSLKNGIILKGIYDKENKWIYVVGFTDTMMVEIISSGIDVDKFNQLVEQIE